MGFFHDHRHAADLEDIILFLAHIEAQDIGKPAASTAFDPYAKKVIIRNVFVLTDLVQRLQRTFGETDRLDVDGWSCFGHSSQY